MANHYSAKGITAGLISGLFWGTPFLVPMALPMFSAIEIAFGRFFFFGLISLIALPRIFSFWSKLSNADRWYLLILSATGFWLYSIVLFLSVKLTNGIIASLIIGLLPLTITLFGKPIFNLKLWLGLILIILGILTLFIIPLFQNQATINTLAHLHLMGILGLAVALVMWTWFAIANSHFLVRHLTLKPMTYSSTMGILSLIFMLPIFLLGHPQNIVTTPHFGAFIFWSIILGIGASWVANIFWAYCSTHCSPSISGTLMVSETVFGLLYSFAFQQRFPTWNEWAAIVLLISGVIIAIRSQLNHHQMA